MNETIQILALGIVSAIVIFVVGCLFGQWLLSRERTGLELVDGKIATINATGKTEVIHRKRMEEKKHA
jgi:hypothetical protein